MSLILASSSLFLAYWLIVPLFCSIIASSKHRSPMGWFLIGLIFNLLGLLLIIGMGSRPAPPRMMFRWQKDRPSGGSIKLEPPRPCPQCKSPNPVAFRFCQTCGQQLR